MKTVFIVLFLIANSFIGKAQIVTIPDPIFKARLLAHDPMIDTNTDGEIQVAEALAFTDTMDVSSTAGDPNGILDLTGLEAFGNMQGFTANNNPFTTADFSGNSALEDIMMNNTQLETMNIQNNQALKTLSITNSNLTNVTVTNKPDLLLLQVNLSQLNQLEIANCPSLQFIYVQSNLLETITLTDLPSLFILNAGSNPLTSINLSTLTELLFLKLDFTNLTHLDVSALENLIQLDVRESSLLEYINLKNGNNQNMDISGGGNSCNFENTTNLTEVCVDAIDSPLSNFIQGQTPQAVTFSTECVLATESFHLPKVTLYPNPSEGNVNIDAPHHIVKISIFTMIGTKVGEISNQSAMTNFSVKALASGRYIVQLEDQNGTIILKGMIKK